ncbi:hypothetical protein [Chryseolinea lacunae]|uniref:Outer membrane protein beta-barrel domain-containing protein n=1 Tax=Chryseolinea lacunae TaxID=2801331 RepID=A0ABS1KVI9_9BACT|nr:hypothetical protein [Chryseolinea lacunae]MBL0743456.1 hypothetical protein [Chryseolinea lacunae]
MKKIIIVLALVAASVGAYAQASVAVGIKGGVNFAKLDGTSASNTFKNRTGYHFGAFTLFKFSKIGIQPEVMFSQ